MSSEDETSGTEIELSSSSDESIVAKRDVKFASIDDDICWVDWSTVRNWLETHAVFRRLASYSFDEKKYKEGDKKCWKVKFI